jgi:hypothetical protein
MVRNKVPHISPAKTRQCFLIRSRMTTNKIAKRRDQRDADCRQEVSPRIFLMVARLAVREYIRLTRQFPPV